MAFALFWLVFAVCWPVNEAQSVNVSPSAGALTLSVASLISDSYVVSVYPANLPYPAGPAFVSTPASGASGQVVLGLQALPPGAYKLFAQSTTTFSYVAQILLNVLSVGGRCSSGCGGDGGVQSPAWNTAPIVVPSAIATTSRPVQNVCFMEGTLISLADGSVKPVESIEYSDELAVWNFDLGRLDSARPVWIKIPEPVLHHHLLKFSDGTELRTAYNGRGHRVYNVEAGMFTSSQNEETPIGAHSFNINGENVEVMTKSMVQAESYSYNILTEQHMNVFANGILTSHWFNNLYPIVNMTFDKVGHLISDPMKYPAAITGSPLFGAYRIGENSFQNIDIPKTIAFVELMESLRKPNNTQP